MNPESAPLLLGAKGWEWPAWDGGFYPEDMPPEWRLTYYNTQFSCVFLPSERWRGAEMEEIAQWARDTHDRFLFLLEGEAGGAVPGALLGRALCLPAEDGRLIWFDGRSDLKALAEELRRPASGPRFLISGDGDLAQLERVRTLLELLGVLA